jgi:hypothetical protein
MGKKVKFYPESKKFEGWFEEPIPAKKIIPEWYKKQDSYSDGVKSMQSSGLFNSTIKSCMPVFDIISAGYILTTPVDINVEINKSDGVPKITWSINDFTPIEEHSRSQFNSYHVPKEYHMAAYKFINKWVIKTPRGYSSMFMTPVFRDDLPFFCLPAIVDTDRHPIAVNFPFFLRKGFEGTILKGTPMIQFLPFKRDSWDHKTKGHNKEDELSWKKAEGTIENRYKKYFRSIKEWK